MKLIKYILCIFMVLAVVYVQPLYAYNDDYYIEDASITWELQENGMMLVYETYEVHFNNLQVKEIEVVVPSHSKVYINSEEIVNDYAVTDVKVLCDHAYRMIENFDGYHITYGNSFQTVNEVEVYEFSYLVKVHPIVNEDYSYVYHELLHAQFDGFIQNLSFTLNLPKEVDDEQISIQIGRYQSQTKDQSIPFTSTGTTITGSYENLYGNAYVGVLLKVEEDYLEMFDYQMVNYISVIVSMMISFLAVWMLRRKGNKQKIEPKIGFEIINELNSAEFGYVLRGYCNQRDVVSLILGWAQKGYITIEYKEDAVIFHKCRNISSFNNAYEKELFKEMFATGNDVRMKMLQTMFGIKIKDSQKQLKRSFSDDHRKMHRSELENLGLCILCGLPMVIVIGAQMFFQTLSLLYLFVIMAVYLFAIGLVTALAMYVKEKQMNHMILWICLFGFAGLLLYQSYLTYGIYISLDILIITVVLTVILIGIVTSLRYRSEYGDEILAKALGLKEFMKKADTEEIKRILENRAGLKEQLLPYAYVMECEKYWVEKVLDDEYTWFVTDGSWDDSFVQVTEKMQYHILSLTVERNYIR